MMDMEKQAIGQLKKIYDKIASLNPKDDNKPEQVNLCNFSAHATNGFALLLTLLTGKQLLPSNEREEKGIPTITGEAKYYKKQGLTAENIEYHNEWQNFMASIDLHTVNPELNTINKYAKYSTQAFHKEFNTFEKKLHKILQKRNLNNMLEETNKKELESIYVKLSSMSITILGDGIGHAKETFGMPGENKYEKINLRLIIVPDDYKEFVQELLSITKAEEVALITQQEFNNFLMDREEKFEELYNLRYSFKKKFDNFNIKDIPQDDNLKQYASAYGYNTYDFVEKFGTTKLVDFYKKNAIKRSYFSEDFVKAFSEKIPWQFYSSDQEVTINKVKKYKNPDKSFTEKTVAVTYHLPFESNTLSLSSINKGQNITEKLEDKAIAALKDIITKLSKKLEAPNKGLENKGKTILPLSPASKTDKTR